MSKDSVTTTIIYHGRNTLKAKAVSACTTLKVEYEMVKIKKKIYIYIYIAIYIP
jgi:hypothetical protein